jgi:hypothetical protein
MVVPLIITRPYAQFSLILLLAIMGVFCTTVAYFDGGAVFATFIGYLYAWLCLVALFKWIRSSQVSGHQLGWVMFVVMFTLPFQIDNAWTHYVLNGEAEGLRSRLDELVAAGEALPVRREELPIQNTLLEHRLHSYSIDGRNFAFCYSGDNPSVANCYTSLRGTWIFDDD